MSLLPDFSQIVVRRHKDVLFVTLNRPQTRNALAPEMVAELAHVIDMAKTDGTLRALVLRGAGGFFCAGGSIGNFRARLEAETTGEDPVATRNREFGHFMERFSAFPLPVIAVVEGGAFGGGFGLACAADLVLATTDARFSLSETTLGIIPAQIAPFVVARLGAAKTRRLGLTGEHIAGTTAVAIGLVDSCAADAEGLDALLAAWLTRIGRCAPGANSTFKRLVSACSGGEDTATVLDGAALLFAQCMREEGAEGTAAFREKRPAAWVQAFDAEDVRLPVPSTA